MIQPYDLVTALDLQDLMLFFWFTLLFDELCGRLGDEVDQAAW